MNFSHAIDKPVIPLLLEKLGWPPVGCMHSKALEAHVAGLCRSCFYQLRRLRIIRHSLSRAAVSTLVHAFICNRIDYCNAALFGASAHLLDRLQSVLRAAARLILNVGKYDHITISDSAWATLAPSSSTVAVQVVCPCPWLPEGCSTVLLGLAHQASFWRTFRPNTSINKSWWPHGATL